MKKTRVKSQNKGKINRRVTKKGGGLSEKIKNLAKNLTTKIKNLTTLEKDRYQLMDTMYRTFKSEIKIETLIEFIKKWRGDRYVNKHVNFKYIREYVQTNGWTPLTLACRYGSLDIVKVLVEGKGADVNYQNLFLDTPLMVSCNYKRKDIVDYLFIKGADVNKVNNKYIYKLYIYKDKSAPGKTALMYACEQKKLGHLTDQKVVEEVDKLNLDIVTVLIDNSADVNAKDYYGIKLNGTALTIALSNEKINTSVVYYLLNIQNIDVNINSYVYGTPIMQACTKQNLDIVNALLKKPNIDLNLQDDQKKTALMYACENKNLDIVNALLEERNIDLNLQDTLKRTALMHACENKNLDIVNALLKKPNIDLNLQDNQNKTAIMHACEKQNLNIVNALLKNPNIDLNLQDNDEKSFYNYIEIFLPNLYNELHLPTNMQNVTL